MLYCTVYCVDLPVAWRLRVIFLWDLHQITPMPTRGAEPSCTRLDHLCYDIENHKWAMGESESCQNWGQMVKYLIHGLGQYQISASLSEKKIMQNRFTSQPIKRHRHLHKLYSWWLHHRGIFQPLPLCQKGKFMHGNFLSWCFFLS